MADTVEIPRRVAVIQFDKQTNAEELSEDV